MFIDARKVAKKLKISAYGGPGCGKTIFGLTFPRPAIVDMERGTDWYTGKEIVPGIGQTTEFQVLHTKSASKVIKAVEWLEAELSRNPEYCGTIVIDPITLFWENLQSAYLGYLRKKAKTEDEARRIKILFHHWKDIKAPYKDLMTRLANLPVHVVLIGREAALYEQEQGELVSTGTRMASEKDTPYTADIHLRLFTKPHPKTDVECFFAVVEKDRTNLLKKGSIIKDCCYKKIMDLASGTLGSGDLVQEERDEQVGEEDQKLFEEEEKDQAVADLVDDDSIKKLWQELDWAPGKVKAVAAKQGLTDRESLGKYLANLVREKRGKE